ncbi:MAG: ribonuclease H-like domain-containing protein [Spirochaetales bacterium]|nr:ribonuclease H-like domain-containing protein [Spirochaetales bacterium]MCF7937580.1 ribonuclease H-like domain-containing protein [Spirochaetales bacterium]
MKRRTALKQRLEHIRRHPPSRKHFPNEDAGLTPPEKPGKGARDSEDLSVISSQWQRLTEYTYRRIEKLPYPGDFGQWNEGSFPFPEGTGPEDCIFYDTETTGLSGGAGTLVFLVGAAWIEKDHLRLEQYFLSDFPGEGEFMEAVAGLFSQKKVAVSYNGKSYDSHLLRGRALMQGMVFPLIQELDLLYLSRRVWGKTLDSCSLKNIEEKVLDMVRGDDLPGSLVPERYFRFLEERDSELLEPVFRHNRDDVLSLVSLTSVLAELPGRVPSGADPLQQEGIKGRVVLKGDKVPYGMDPKAIAGLAALLGRFKDPRSAAVLETAFHAGSVEAGRALGRMHRIDRRYESAEAVWRRLEKMGDYLHARLELAKYYEHRLKDIGRALELVEACLYGCEIDPKKRPSWIYRRNRLQRKLKSKIGNPESGS